MGFEPYFIEIFIAAVPPLLAISRSIALRIGLFVASELILRKFVPPDCPKNLFI